MMERMLVFLFLLFLPTQLGRHYWPEWSRVAGLRVDYLSPTLYFLDLIWLLIFLVVRKNWKRLKIMDFDKFWWLVLIFVNVWMAKYRWVAVYRWLRVWQLVWMVRYLAKRKRWLRQDLIVVIPIWVIFESLLGLGQIINGSSLNGWLYWLGERRFSYTTIGVAQISVLGRGLIRAYGTFSHPNSLAGFLLVAILLWFGYKGREKDGLFDWGRVWWWVVLWLGVMGIILSGSRLVWLVTAGLLIFRFKKKMWLGFGVLLLGIFVLVMAGVSVNYVLGDFLGGWDILSWEKRVFLGRMALDMIRDNPLFGVGWGNFLVELPEYQRESRLFFLQPVHNLPLLLVAELGVVGFVLCWKMIKKMLTRVKLGMIEKSIWVAVLVTGMFDHYWLSLPQNNWILVVFLALVLR